MAFETEDLCLLANANFRRLIQSRVAGQIAQNALLYGLLIHVVEETGSSLHSTFLVAAFTLPVILLGIPAGVLAEVLPRRLLITVSYVLRALAVIGMLYYRDDIWRVYLLVMALSTASQLAVPAESAALPRLVRPEQLTSANSFLVFTMMIGQVVGAVIMAPFLLKILGVEAVYVVSTGLYLYAALLIAGARGLAGQLPATEAGTVEPITLGEAFVEGWQVLRSNRRVFMALTYLAVAGTLAKALAVLAPHYTKDVLNIETENAVYVMAPAAIGAVAGLVLTPVLAKFLGASRTALTGFLLFVAGLIALGFIVYVRNFVLDNIDFGIGFVEDRLGVSSVITMAMMIAIPVGLAITMVTVAAKSVLNQEAPPGTQARVFATQSAVADGVALLPLFIIGGVAEVVGVRAVLLVTALAALAGTAYLGFSSRFQPPSARTPVGDG